MTLHSTSDALCWVCNDRQGEGRVGLCVLCLQHLRGQSTIPPGDTLFPKGTLPEDIGPYRQPLAAEYRTWPS